MKPTFYIRNLPIYGDAILAPMDGYSDWPFRSLCRGIGSAVSYTEFVDVEKILGRSKQPARKFFFEESERPIAFQLYGDDPDEILEAALKVQELRPDMIDVNLGCPAKTVARRGAGVGMMRTPLKVAKTFRKLTAALEIPVTAKIRLGWDDCRSYKLIVRIVEENGGALIAIHARTKEQGYSGQANWDAIAEVKSLVKIPVIGNGDVRKVADIARMRQYTHCDAVMIGRGAIANPWIFAGLDRDQVSSEAVQDFLRRHLERNIQFYGEEDGRRLFRKHAIQYLMMQSLSRETRKQILRERPAEEFAALISEMYAQTQPV
ncbi:MAG: tRNA dihydrouridine synthase DusB [Anaerolineales bacterium]